MPELTAPDRGVWGWAHKAYSLRRVNGGGIEKAKVVLEEAAKLSPAEPQWFNTTWLATAPNWVNWMPLKRIWVSHTNLEMPGGSILWRWMRRVSGVRANFIEQNRLLCGHPTRVKLKPDTLAAPLCVALAS